MSYTQKVTSNLQRARTAVAIAKREGVPFWRRWSRLTWLYVARQFSLREIIGFDLLQDTPPVDAYISKQKSLSILLRVNSEKYACLTENKVIFESVCASNNLPMPKSYLIFINGRVRNNMASAESDGTKKYDIPTLPDTFVAKPADGAYGRGITAWRRDKNIWIASNGTRLTRTQLLEFYMETSLNHTYILQQQLYAHPELQKLSGADSVQSLRLVTIRSPNSDPGVDVLFGFIRISGGSTVIDNFSFGENGNLLCPVDVKHGRISTAWYRGISSNHLKAVDRHPITSCNLPGVEVPCFDDALKLVKRAAEVFYPLPAIGWDVAITPSGPLLIEGNAYWDTEFGEVLPQSGWQRICAISR